MELASIEGELKKLQEFAKRSGCEDVRALTTAKITQIEREDKVCKDEDVRRNRLFDPVRRQSDRARLIGIKDEAIKFEKEMTCTRLRPSVVEALGTVRVKIAQIELRRLGCFSGSNDGIFNDSTRDAVKLFFTTLGRPDGDVDVTEGLLSDLAGQNAAVCKPSEPSVVERPGREPPPRRASAPPRPERSVRSPRRERDDPPPRATQRAERPQPQPQPQAAPRQSAPSSGGGVMIGVGF